MVGFESVVVVIVVCLTFDWAGTSVMCCMSLVQFRHSGMVVVSDMVVMDVVLCVELLVGAPLSCEASASHITNAACTFMIVFKFLQGRVLIRLVSTRTPL